VVALQVEPDTGEWSRRVGRVGGGWGPATRLVA